MSDVGGMVGRKDGGKVVMIVEISGQLNKAQFDELIEALKDLAKKYPSLKVKPVPAS
jgi:hypothetical protein